MESLLLFRRALSSPTMCRFIPALPVPDFSLALSASELLLQSGDSWQGAVAVTATPINGFAAPILWSTSQVLDGVQETSTTTTALSVGWAFSAPAPPQQGSTQQIVLTATSGTIAHSVTLTLTAEPPPAPAPDFTLTVSGPSATAPGGFGVQVTPINGFVGTILLSIETNLPTAGFDLVLGYTNGPVSCSSYDPIDCFAPGGWNLVTYPGQVYGVNIVSNGQTPIPGTYTATVGAGSTAFMGPEHSAVVVITVPDTQ
jgi:hypothetical protein